jgi:4-deoxy-L-threo-5-hexosulose-uronate ketol-isomerase
MKIESRYSTHPNMIETCNTDDLREHFLIESIFENDEIVFTYSHVERLVVGGAKPVNTALTLETCVEVGADPFLERRELGIINIGQAGSVSVDGTVYQVGPRDGLYLGKGCTEVIFTSADAANPAKFYLASTPAHETHPTTLIPHGKARRLELGSTETANERTINQYVHPEVCGSCQLLMGMTALNTGSVWNSMPCHLHDRRSEVYFYFDMDAETRVFHFMGEPDETRHLVVANEQAVIAPSWSIHTGAGTSNYTFIWAMGGDNQVFEDMDAVAMDELR